MGALSRIKLENQLLYIPWSSSKIIYRLFDCMFNVYEPRISLLKFTFQLTQIILIFKKSIPCWIHKHMKCEMLRTNFFWVYEIGRNVRRKCMGKDECRVTYLEAGISKNYQVSLRLSCGSFHGSYCLNIELAGLTWALLSVPILCMHREGQPKVSLRWQDLRLKTRTQNA